MLRCQLILPVLAFCGLSPFLLQAQSVTAPAAPAADLAPPAHPATAAQIRAFLALSHSTETAQKLMSQMLKSSRVTSAPYYTPGFWDDIEKAIMEIDLVTPVIPAYQKYFSEEDMAATIAFYKSPSGKRLLEAQPFVTSAVSEVLRQAGQAAGHQVGLKHKDEIESLMKKSAAPGPTPEAAPANPPNKSVQPSR